tara:strand:+ start:374 stop:1507 length:1134 start_codon:yes stop_codon:yes gene_type:complete
MPSKIKSGQIDETSFTELFLKKLSGSDTVPSGFYTVANPSGYVPLTAGGPDSMTGYSGDIMSRTSGLISNVSGALNTSGDLLFQKAVDVSGFSVTLNTATSGYLQTEIETASGDFSTVSGEFLKSGSFFHVVSGDFSTSAPTGALAYSSGDARGLYVVTGDSTAKEGWAKLSEYPEMTGYVSTTSGDIKTSLEATGTNLSNLISNVNADSSTNFTAKKTFSAGLKTELMELGTDGVTMRVNSNNSVSFDDVSGALLTVAPGYGADAPVFSVTDKAGLPLIDVFDDDRINFGPFGTNPLNVSGEKVCLGNYRSFFSGSDVHLSGKITVNDMLTVSGLSGGYAIFNNLPEHPNTGGLPIGTLFVSGNNTAGKGRHLMII